MGKFSVNIKDEIENEFRENAVKKYGFKRGYLTLALCEAMKLFNLQIKNSPKDKIEKR